METTNSSKKNVSKVRSIILLLAVFFITGCSKDDDITLVVKSSAKELTNFKFLSTNNTVLSIDVTANIDTIAKTITATLPSDIPLSALTPTISVSVKASISPTGVQDFTNPVTYSVSAEDGSTNSFEVTLSSNSSAKQITSFVFLLTNNPINVNIVATIDEENKTITATMPIGTDVTGLLPEIRTSALATVTPDTAKNFTASVEYTVIAEDGSEVMYTVTITVLLSQRQILQAILDANPQNSLGWDLENTPNLNSLNGVTTNFSGNITDLYLGFGNISIIPSVIGQLTTIKSLNLSGNGIAELPPEIGFLKQLSTLNLSLNPIRVLPSEIGQLIKLEEVICQQTGLNSIPVEIGLLTNLKKLNLSSNNLTSIPAEIGQLSSLEVLSFGNNQLTSIPAEIAQLSSLEVLSFNDNKLTSIPAEIGQLNNLSSLKLYGNQLIDIPSEIGALANLGVLLLMNNQLTSVPAEIGFLNGLYTLNIQNNNLTTIPQSIYNRISIMDLFLDTGVVPETVSQKDALISIYSANPGNTLGWGVDNFPEVDFDANGNPKTITINNKNITRIPDNIDQLTALENLNVNSNNLEAIPSSIGNISTLVVLTLASNQLSTVPSELGQLTGLALLSLTSNPISSIPTEVCGLQTSNGGILTIISDAGEGCN